jgi:CheY-like chemotaxis protein
MRRKILWIEDEHAYYVGLKSDLDDLADLTISNTKDEAVQTMIENRFDLIILDVMLPDDKEDEKVGLINLRAGQDILAKLREESKDPGWKTLPNTRVLVITAQGVEEQLAKVEELIGGQGRLLEKPNFNERIIAAVQEELGLATSLP